MVVLALDRSRKKETGMFGFDRITSDPNVLGGKACIRGMRISVSLIVNLVANGMAVEEIVDEYPDLEPEDIRQALRYAAWAAELDRALTETERSQGDVLASVRRRRFFRPVQAGAPDSTTLLREDCAR
jgi:uncharacterized protein (DUF433 family)